MSGVGGSLPSWARVGVRVVCVADFTMTRQVSDKGYRRFPEERSVYTIARAVWYDGDPVACLYLAGFPSDHGFDIRGFEPAVMDQAQERDVALFRKLLTLDQKLPESVE